MKFSVLSTWQLCMCLSATALDMRNARPAYNQAVDNGTYGSYPVRTFATEEGLAAPRVNWLQWSPECDDGRSYLITPRGASLTSPGPMILDRDGELVWTKHFDNDFGGQAYDFKVQRYQSQDYLTFWLGDDSVRGHGAGVYYMLNSSYDIVHKVGAVNGLSADLHEFLITPQGTALMTMYEIVPQNLSSFRDFDPEKEEDQDPNFMWDCIFQEISIHNGRLLFEWRVSDHLNLTDTYREIREMGTYDNPFDWYHINSISKDELGNYIISARYTHSITYIDGKTGEILWILGGKLNDFMDLSDGFALNFAWQHDARFRPFEQFADVYTPPEKVPGVTTKLLTLFDNAARDQDYIYGHDVSRGLLLELSYPTERGGAAAQGKVSKLDHGLKGRTLDEEKISFINGTNPAFTVRVIMSYENPRKVRSSSQGSLQILPSSENTGTKVFMGYGVNAVWTEFDSNGTVLCDAHFGAESSWESGDIQSYRAYKFAWTGLPKTRPLLEISDDDLEVYASWNGATEVAEWILQGALVDDDDEQETWADIVRIPKRGFETVIPLTDHDLGSRPFLRVLAVDAEGELLEYGESLTLDRGFLTSYFPMVDSNLPQEVFSAAPIRIFIILVAAVVVIVMGYNLCWKVISWRHGRSSAGPIRWRKGVSYKLLGEA